MVNSLLSPLDAPERKAARIAEFVDNLLDGGNLPDAEAVLDKHGRLLDHKGIIEKKSDSRLILYVAGYVVRKSLKKFPCPGGASCLCVLPIEAESRCNATLTNQFDHGGLVYPSYSFEGLVTKLENAFTTFFSRNKLHADSLVSFLIFLQGCELEPIGCTVHKRRLTGDVIKFYALTRLHFFTKSLNKNVASKRGKQKHLKMRRCQ